MPVDADRNVPGLIVKFGDYPLHHGGVGAIRSLGRLGIPMYAITEDRYTPAAASRYLRRAFVWPTTGTEEPERLVEGLLRIGARIGRPTVLVPTDEEAAVLIAEHPEELGERFLFPAGRRRTAQAPRQQAGPARTLCGTRHPQSERRPSRSRTRRSWRSPRALGFRSSPRTGRRSYAAASRR